MKRGFISIILVACLLTLLNADSLLTSVKSSPVSQYKPQQLKRPKHEYQLHDTIMMNISIKDVWEFARKFDTKRDLSWAAKFKQFITHFGGATKKEPPNVEFETSGELKSDGQSRESAKVRFNIPAEVIEKLPNGDLVLDASRTVQISHDTALVRVGGIVSPENIDKKKKEVMSEWIKQLDLKTESKGPLNDNRKRGFIIKFLERFRLF